MYTTPRRTIPCIVKRRIGVLSEVINGANTKTRKEINRVAWNNSNIDRYDVRPWIYREGEPTQPAKGITFTDEEAYSLYLFLKAEFEPEGEDKPKKK